LEKNDAVEQHQNDKTSEKLANQARKKVSKSKKKKNLKKVKVASETKTKSKAVDVKEGSSKKKDAIKSPKLLPWDT